jgi:DNA-binding beta-propeller fold protein YncE
VLVTPPGGETLALRIFNLLHYGHTAHVNANCLLLLGLAIAPVLVVAAFVRARRYLGGLAVGSGLMLTVATGCSPNHEATGTALNSALFARVEIVATRGVAPGQVNKPRSVAVDHDDNLFVLDFTGRVQKFSPQGEFLLFWQMPETERGNPKGLSIDPDGNVIVVEPHYSRVNLFTPDGELLMQWGVKGTNEGQIWFPRAAVVDSSGHWYVSEYGVVDRVQQFTRGDSESPGLEFVAAYGTAGDAPGQFNRAEGLAVDAADRVLVADAVNHRVQVLTPRGEVRVGYGSAGSREGELSYPYDIGIDREGRHYVCEFGNSRIQVFDPAGRSLEIIGRPGSEPGLFNNPWGVALDSEDNLYVADSRNHRVQKFIRRDKVSNTENRRQHPRVTARHAQSIPSTLRNSAPAEDGRSELRVPR